MKTYTSKLCTTISNAPHDDHVFSGIHIINEDVFAESYRTFFSKGAQVVLDFVNTDIFHLTECISKFGQILSVRQSSDSATTPFALFRLPATVGYRLVDVLEVLKHQLGRLEMPELGHGTAASPFITTKTEISSMNTVFASMKYRESEERIAIELYDDSQVRVTEPAQPFPSKLDEANSVIQVYQPSLKEDLFDPLSTYVVSGGLGKLGRFTATWMVSRGARHLVLLSRSGPKIETARNMIRNLENAGVHVYTPPCDVSNPSALEMALKEICGAPPIKGCIHTAGALKVSTQ